MGSELNVASMYDKATAKLIYDQGKEGKRRRKRWRKRWRKRERKGKGEKEDPVDYVHHHVTFHALRNFFAQLCDVLTAPNHDLSVLLYSVMKVASGTCRKR